MAIDHPMTNHVEGGRFKKVCHYGPCAREFTSNARHTKFCSDECCGRYQKSKRHQRAEYQKNRGAKLLWVRSHSLAVEVFKEMVVQGKRMGCCEFGECQCKVVEIHHISSEYLDNREENLTALCKEHHARVHSGAKGEIPCLYILVNGRLKPKDSGALQTGFVDNAGVKTS